MLLMRQRLPSAYPVDTVCHIGSDCAHTLWAACCVYCCAAGVVGAAGGPAGAVIGAAVGGLSGAAAGGVVGEQRGPGGETDLSAYP
jgi:hypothetical protein